MVFMRRNASNPPPPLPTPPHSGFACGNRAKNQSFQKPLKLKPFKDTSLTMMYANL